MNFYLRVVRFQVLEKLNGKHLKRIKPGDYLLCYATGIYRFIGVLEVSSEPYFDKSGRISKIDAFPSRVPVEVLFELKPENGVPVLNLKDNLEMFKELKNPNGWGILFRSSPKKLNPNDGQLIVDSIEEASKNPIYREYDEAKWMKAPEKEKQFNLI